MTKPLTIGDLVWYNVGGRGYETMGLVIETADLWMETCTWSNIAKPKKYANCVRIKWMRVGKLKPRKMHLPLYRQLVRYVYEDLSCEISGFREWERNSVLPQLMKVENGEWYEGQFFKAMK